MDAETRRRRVVLAILAAGLPPWSIQVYFDGPVSFLFPWGTTTPSTGSLTTIYHYFFVYTAGVPGYVLGWPVSVGLWALALVSAVVAVRFGRDDARVTAGLLVLAGVAQFDLALGFSFQPGRVAVPLGTAMLWAVAGWVYWSAARAR